LKAPGFNPWNLKCDFLVSKFAAFKFNLHTATRRLDRQDLANMKAGWKTDGILGPATHLPQLINPMKHFLWILRTTHGGGNMDSAGCCTSWNAVRPIACLASAWSQP
jgi:hypothetical protein